MKIYLAGASAEADRAERVSAALLAMGHKITSTWWEVIKAAGEANPANATRAQYLAWVERDLLELHHADALVLLLPALDVHTVGAWIELGFAVRAHHTIIMSGPHRPIFTPALAHYTVPTDEDLFMMLRPVGPMPSIFNGEPPWMPKV